MRILALDPSGTTGYCDAEIRDDKLYIIDYGIVDQITDDTATYGERCLDLNQKVKQMVANQDMVIVEDYHFSGKFAQGSSINVGYRAAIWMACTELGIKYEIINESEWKKGIAGRSRPSKPDVAKWGKTKAKKFFIQEALWDRFSIRFPTYRLSPKTGKPVQPLSDYVDATAFLIYYVFNRIGKMDVVSKNDFDNSIVIKGSFQYSKE
jgi:Holliday junction resolvasome RuvABC endonuclease subunit